MNGPSTVLICVFGVGLSLVFVIIGIVIGIVFSKIKKTKGD